MKVELFPFQKRALMDLRMKAAEALGSFQRTHTPQVISFTAPTGAGKTIIMSALIESIFCGDEIYCEQPNAIVIWLSDSPQLNEQSKLKIDMKSDKIQLEQCITINEDSFDKKFFEDGHIYFLNTQKLSASSRLTRVGDQRTYSIWQTLANTVRDKSDRLYFIIDEAHRGMQGQEASRATSIMQKFIKGSDMDGIPPMPVVIGMSATTERFNRLVEGTSSTIYKSIVTADEVRASGLLKDFIAITYPDDEKINDDMAILQAAASDWKEKWEHWTQYCQEQHYAYVNPIFIIQVQNGTGKKLSTTDLDECLKKIKEQTGWRFKEGQVVHTFGQTTASIFIDGINVPYVEPSRIADDKNIRIVFFKENLTTGWDCPRAETMMSFKTANDATYIAQLLGRMIRTPLQMHIQVDEVLNNVHLFLPHFNERTVNDIVNELQKSEGETLPVDIYGESLKNRKFEILTVKSNKRGASVIAPDQINMFDELDDTNSTETIKDKCNFNGNVEMVESSNSALREQVVVKSDLSLSSKEHDLFDREDVVKFINESGLLSYKVRSVRISDYLKSLCKMANLLTLNGLWQDAIRTIQEEIIQIIDDYIRDLKKRGEYEKYVRQVRQFKLATQVFDIFGETVDDYMLPDLFTTTDTDIDRKFRIAENKLGNEGIGIAYVQKYANDSNVYECKINVILFTEEDECLQHLQIYAEKRFHSLNDEFRRYIAKVGSERVRKQYDAIISDGDTISKHNFRLPETIQRIIEKQGKEYRNHLFVNNATGVAIMKLNTWEEGVIKEEQQKKDFVCWIRNPVRAPWALCIPYEINGEIKAAYPDFIIVRKDPRLKYAVDILEPHNPELKDNLGKAKGFAKYAKQNPGVGRIQLIRMSKDVLGNNRFKRLDMAQGIIQNKVLHAVTNEELDHIFDEYGFFM